MLTMKEVLHNITDDESFETMEISPQDDYVPNEMPYSDEELRRRLEKSRQDYLTGRIYTTAEVLAMCRKQVDLMPIAV